MSQARGLVGISIDSLDSAEFRREKIFEIGPLGPEI